MEALSFLGSLDMMSLVFLFWYTALLEIPRYFVGALVVPILASWRDDPVIDPDLSISIILVGHNEEKPLPACVHSLAEQTILSVCKDVQIIVVDDGSTDRMREVALRLQREGRVDNVLILEQRGGKSAGVNLALSVARGDIVVISDIDTTFDRDALAELTACFSDPLVGAVSGNLGVRNASASVATRYQAIEYAVGISLGRCIADAFGTLSVISGAFGAFRREAVEECRPAGRGGWRGRRPDDETAQRGLAPPFRATRKRADRCPGNVFGLYRAAASLGSRSDNHLGAKISQSNRPPAFHIPDFRCGCRGRRDFFPGHSCRGISRLSRVAVLLFRLVRDDNSCGDDRRLRGA